jgi:hypothetical protein
MDRSEPHHSLAAVALIAENPRRILGAYDLKVQPMLIEEAAGLAA